MMKSKITQHLQTIYTDKVFLSIIVVTLLIGVMYTLFVTLSVKAQDIQVLVHYSSFGEAHFYRAQWHYLVLFALLGLITSIGHSAIAVKLYMINRRQAALLFGAMSILLLVILWSYTASLLRMAYL